MLEKYWMKFSDVEICVQVRRSSRKSIGLEIKQEWQVIVRVPGELSDREIKNFLEKHRDWIWKKWNLMKSRQCEQLTTQATPVSALTEAEKEAIGKKIAGRVAHYSQIMGVTYGRITIRNQKTRWGSCSAKGNLNFNYQLYYLPDELLDYVVVHELAHRRHMDHSAAFWQEVADYFPDYQRCRKRLREIRLV